MLPIDSIIQASQRLNPCMDLEADIVTVEASAGVASAADWNQATVVKSSDIAVSSEGQVSLAPSGTSTIFSQVTDHSVHNHVEQIGVGSGCALDFFPDPTIFASQTEIVLASLQLYLGSWGGGTPGAFKGTVRFQVTAFDQNWKRQPIASPIDIVSDQLTPTGALFTLDLSKQVIRFSPGWVLSNTGDGRDNSGNLRQSTVKIAGVSTLFVAKGFSVVITIPSGVNGNSLWIGCADNALVANLNNTTFWRVATGGTGGDHSIGPYPPNILSGFSPLDINHSPDPQETTGAVPGFGAMTVASGSFGISRIGTARVLDAQLWAVPYHVLAIQTYPANGTVAVPLDLEVVPTEDVECRFDDIALGSESVTYNLHASSDNFGSSDITVGTVQDGDVVSTDGVHRTVGAIDTLIIAGTTFLQRYYKVTATLTSSTGATHYATPYIQAITLEARQTFSTFRYIGDMQSSCTIDPTTGQSEIAELKLPIYRLTQDARDLATQLASQYAPQNVEARIYAVNRVSKMRWYKDSFRLEQRDPSDDQEAFTFLGVTDRLKASVPLNSEQGQGVGSYAVQAVSTSGAGPVIVTVQVTGTPFAAGLMQPNGLLQGAGPWRTYWTSGTLNGQSITILAPPSFAANTSNAFLILVPTTADVPSIGDTFEVHSDVFQRSDVQYAAEDFADVFRDVRDNQAQVPARYRGTLPPATGRFTTASLIGKNNGTAAADVLAALALHCGGVVFADQGKIQFADIFGDQAPSITWDERHYVSLDTPTGMDRRMPIVQAGYNFDFAGTSTTAGGFANQAQFVDFNAFLGYGLANLFDVMVLPDLLCQWNDGPEAQNLALMMLGAFSSGVRLWKVKTVLAYPWLTIGDRVGIATRQYTDRRVIMDAAGNDTGSPIAGRTLATGAIVGKDLWGQEFLVMVPGVSAIQSSFAALGGLGGPFDDIAVPDDFHLTANVQGDPAAVVAWVTALWTAPNTPFFDHMEYSVQSRRTGDLAFGASTTVVGTASGADRIVASPSTDVAVTPITVSTTGHRFAGRTFVISVPIFSPPAPTITVMAGASANTYTVEWDFTTRYVRWWSKVYTSATDPGSPISVYNVGTEMPQIDNFTLTSGPEAVVQGQAIDATNLVEIATFVAYDAHSETSGFINFRTVRATPVAPSAPASAANTSVTSSSVTNHVVMPSSISNFDFIRTYKNGVVLPPDTARTALASGTQTLTHSGLSPAEHDSWQYSGVSTSGGESAKTTAFLTATTAATIPTPTISSVDYDAPSQSFSITIAPAAGTPSGVTWHLKAGTSTPPTTEITGSATTSTTMTFRFLQSSSTVQVFFLVWGTLTGWSPSANSAIANAFCPPTGGAL